MKEREALPVISDLAQGPELSPEQVAQRVKSALDAQQAADLAQVELDRLELKNATVAAAMRATGLSQAELEAQAATVVSPPLPLDPACDPLVKVRSNMQAARCPELHIRHVGDSPPFDCEAIDTVRLALAGDRWLVLASGKGTGKTAAGVWALGQRRGVFVKASRLLDLAFGDREKMEQIREARMVVLDDLGTEVQDEKGYWPSKLTDLVDDWYGNCAVVIFTTNLTAEQFKKRYGERVADRIRERGSFVTLKGESRRAAT